MAKNQFQYYNLVEPPEYLKQTQQNYTSQTIPETEEIDQQDSLSRFQELISKTKSQDSNLENPTIEVESQVEPTIDSEFIDINKIFEPEVKQSSNKNYVFNDRVNFIRTFRPIIEKELIRNNISTNFTDYLISQIALESGWGSKPSGKNNFAGIKDNKSGTKRTTKEFVNGKYVTVKQGFKNYDSLEDFVKDYVHKLNTTFDAFKSNSFLSNIKSKGYFTAPLQQYKRIFDSILYSVRKRT